MRPVSALVLHYTGVPTLKDALDLLLSPQAEVSAHYVVAEDGEVFQLVPESRRAWHAGRSFWRGETDMNSASIGIEVQHPGHVDARPYPRAQIDSLITLARDVCARNRIPARQVVAHSDIAVTRKIDPGEFFPWDALAAGRVGLFAPPVPIEEGGALAPGAEGEGVASLRRELAAFGYDVDPDGPYDERLGAVVAAFQRHYRPARVDGRADASTRKTLARLLDSVGELA